MRADIQIDLRKCKARMNPSVINLYLLDAYRLELTFENGEVRVFDAKPYLHKRCSSVCKIAPRFKLPG